ATSAKTTNDAAAIDAIVLEEDTQKVIVDPHLFLLEDRHRTYTPETIISGQMDAQFKVYSGNGRPNLGYTKSAYWVRIQVHNQSEQQQWLLDMSAPKINVVKLYETDANTNLEHAGQTAAANTDLE